MDTLLILREILGHPVAYTTYTTQRHTYTNHIHMQTLYTVTSETQVNDL